MNYQIVVMRFSCFVSCMPFDRIIIDIYDKFESERASKRESERASGRKRDREKQTSASLTHCIRADFMLNRMMLAVDNFIEIALGICILI